MPTIGWIFTLLILVTIIGGLYMLHKTANRMPIGGEQMKKIKQRQAELEEQEREQEH